MCFIGWTVLTLLDANISTKKKYIVNKDNNDIKYLDEVGKLRSDISVDLLNSGDIRYICRSTKPRWYQIYL